jgi:hypothetical protein
MVAEICGDPFSGIGCPIPGCTHDGPDAALQYHVVLAERECDQLRAELADAQLGLRQAVEMANDLGGEVLELRALLRQVRDAVEFVYDEDGTRVASLIDASRLLDDEGQQNG